MLHRPDQRKRRSRATQEYRKRQADGLAVGEYLCDGTWLTRLLKLGLIGEAEVALGQGTKRDRRAFQ